MRWGARLKAVRPRPGYRRGADIAEGWEIERLHAEPTGDAGKTEDAEAVTRHEGWIYIFGSHFGSKDGPLQPKRGFVARFREADVGHATQDPAMEMEISRESFLVHRLINDALKDQGPDLIPLGPTSHEALIAATIRRGENEDKRWAGLVREDDYPINVEARPSARAARSSSASVSPSPPKVTPSSLSLRASRASSSQTVPYPRSAVSGWRTPSAARAT